MPVQPIQRAGHIEAERFLLKILIMYPEAFKKIKNIISYNDFTDIRHRKIAKIIYDLYTEKGMAPLDRIQSQLDENGNEVLQEIQNQVIPEKNIDKALADCQSTIREYKLMNEKSKIQKELKSLEELENKSQDQLTRIKELCIHYEKIVKELKMP